jgi:murein DD-endopeptidase MepM/ murein hydrolase activator NlpD
LAIDFGARAGTPVRAAAPGIVAYAGNQVRGYGNVVIVVHPRGYVTWYAHHRQNLVVPGQRVERGERLGTVGATGYARGAHLHFMLVHRGQHCDAMPLFRGELRKRSGATLRVSSLRWKRRRPEGLRCLRRSKRPHPGRRSRRH